MNASSTRSAHSSTKSSTEQATDDSSHSTEGKVEVLSCNNSDAMFAYSSNHEASSNGEKCKKHDSRGPPREIARKSLPDGAFERSTIGSAKIGFTSEHASLAALALKKYHEQESDTLGEDDNACSSKRRLDCATVNRKVYEENCCAKRSRIDGSNMSARAVQPSDRIINVGTF